MLSLAVGEKGSFCDECGSPATRGFELTGMSKFFMCGRCAESKFGERETRRAIDTVKALVQGGIMQKIAPVVPRDPLPQRPMGFLRRDDRDPPGPSCASESGVEGG